MKKFIFGLIIFALYIVPTSNWAQTEKVVIEDFIEQHQGFEENDEGEIIPINIKEINKKIRFFVEEKYPNVEYTRNIIWDSYETFISPFDKFHFHTFICQIKVKELQRLKYLEVTYNPLDGKVNSDFEWYEEQEEFYPKKEIEDASEARN
ncbi:MAG: hypothetical protein ACON4L_06505 [Flavobacteriaceae bacterium]